MAIKKSLLLVPVTLCFLLLVVTSQDTDYEDDEDYYNYFDAPPEGVLTVNGTVVCPENPSADVEDSRVSLLLFNEFGSYSSVRSDFPGKRGRFRFGIRKGSPYATRASPGFMLDVEPPENPSKPCPSGLKLEAYGVYDYGRRSVGVSIYANGTRNYAWIN